MRILSHLVILSHNGEGERIRSPSNKTYKEDCIMNQQSEETFSISQVSERTGVTENRIRDWHEKGFLPEIQQISVGSRLHRRFTERDIQMISTINEYQIQGFVLKVAVEKAKDRW